MPATKKNIVEICAPSFEDVRCGKCWRCKAIDESDKVAALYYELYRVLVQEGFDDFEAVKEKHRSGMLVHRSPSTAQLQYIAKVK